MAERRLQVFHAVAKETRFGELARVPLSPRLMRDLSVVYPRQRFRSRLADTFIQFAKSGLAESAGV